MLQSADHFSTRCELRQLACSEASDWSALSMQAQLWPDWRHFCPSPKEMGNFLARCEAETALQREVAWGIFAQSQGRLFRAGMIRLHGIMPTHKRCQMSTWLAPSWQRKGLNLQAKLLVLDYAFATLGMNRVECNVAPDNVASCASLESIGAVCEGVLSSYVVRQGMARDIALYRLLAIDWPMLKVTLNERLLAHEQFA
jgi:N-acetyltransferase